MTRKLILVLGALAGLSGCVAVPVYDAPPAYGYYYGPPAASVTFGYTKYGPGYRNFRGHRHWHRY